MNAWISKPQVEPGSRWLVLLAGLWLLGAGLALVAAVGLWPGGAPAHLSFQQLALFVTAAVAAWFGLALAARRPWSQPLAVAYCLWLALTAGLALLLTWPYGSLTAWLLARTGPLLDADSWTGLIAFGLLLVVAGSVLGGFEFSRPGALRLFRRDAPPTLVDCPLCGASLDSQGFCPYCDRLGLAPYLLQPLLPKVARLVLDFGPGRWRIQVGREVPNGHAWVDEAEHILYQSISRRHADIELDRQTGQLTILPQGYNEVLVNGKRYTMSAPLHLGDFIRMGQVDFVLAQEGREPVVAFLYDFSDSAETKTHLLCFNVHDDHRRYEWHIGRAKENDIVLPEDWQTVSRQQATILYNQENNAFYIRNDSQQIDTLTVNEQPLPPGSFVEMAQIGETRLGLGNHLFWFMPVPYEPAPRR